MWSILLRHVGEMILMVALLVASGFFSGSETAMFSLTRGQRFRLRHGSSRFGHLVVNLLRQPSRLLNTQLLGNMMVNVAYGTLAAMISRDLLDNGYGPAAAGASLVYLLGLILCGEVVPKMIAYRITEKWSLLAAAPMALIGRVLGPIVWVLEKATVAPLTQLLAPQGAHGGDITADDLAAVVKLSARQGHIEQDAGAMLEEIVHLSEIRARDIMVPRVEIVAYNVDAPREGLLELFAQTHLRKVPVYAGDVDNIIGIVHRKRVFLNPDKPLRELVGKVIFAPEAATAERLLVLFRAKRTQLAIVVDEYGGTAGVVTLEDVLEEIVGDLPDGEGETNGDEELSRQISENEYLLDGALGVHEWADVFGQALTAERVSTVSGFVTALLGRVPRVGDEATYRNLRFVVESVRGRRAGRIRVLRETGDAS